MSTEDEQNKYYRDIAVKNTYNILCKMFCKAETMHGFMKASLKDKKKKLRELAEEII